MDGVQVVDLGVLVVFFDLGHAGLREARDDDAGVGEHVDLLGRIDALGDALIEAAGVDSTAAMAVTRGCGSADCGAGAHGCACDYTNDEGGGRAGLDHGEKGEQSSGQSDDCVLHVCWIRFDTSGLNLRAAV